MFEHGDNVMFQGERFRVSTVINNGRDVVIRNATTRLIVSPLCLTIGWN